MDRERAVYAPLAACEAVMVTVPVRRGVTLKPLTLAKVGSEEVNVNGAGEFEVGMVITVAPASSEITTSGKFPRIVVVACAT